MTVKWYQKFPKAYAAVKAAIISFLSVWGLQLIGWVTDVSHWASGGGHFPDPSVLGKGAVALFVGVFIALVHLGVNYAQEKGWLPGQAPSYPTTPDDTVPTAPVAADSTKPA